MDLDERFKIVFEKLEEIKQQETAAEPSSSELDEIEELRRFSAELQQPDPTFFTTT